MRGALLEAFDQRIDTRIIGLALPPIELLERREAMLLDREHLLGRERPRPFLDQSAEGPIALVPPGAPGDLRHLGYAQTALAMAVELVEAGKGDVRHVHVEPHADRVGRDEIIDLARLEHRDLRVARPGAERAHHHRRSATQAPQHLGDGIHFLGAERDDRRALGQPADLLRAGIAQRREARAVDDLDPGHQRLEHRPQRLRAEQHRLLTPACAQDPVGKDVATLGIGAELRLVERNERQILVERHRFGGTQEPARVLRDDLFLAGDQRDAVLALELDDAVIDLARQQPQRKADHPARMPAHPLDREMGLAGIGRSEHRRDGMFCGTLHDACNIACRAPKCNH